MKEYRLGEFVVSIAGHDKGEPFIIIGIEGDYLILADGKRRTIEHPKRKKKKHVKAAEEISALVEAIETGRITDEMIKYERKRYLRDLENGGSYVESRCCRD